MRQKPAVFLGLLGKTARRFFSAPAKFVIQMLHACAILRAATERIPYGTCCSPDEDVCRRCTAGRVYDRIPAQDRADFRARGSGGEPVACRTWPRCRESRQRDA